MSNDVKTGLSLYIHISFCARKCRYCDFYSVPVGGLFSADNVSLVNQYIDALCLEWQLYKNSGILDDMAVKTVYIGGGTPSILNADMWGRLSEKLFSTIDKTEIKEWSVECNPESFCMDKAQMYAKSGVTRLTFGVQSLNAGELSICGRAHSAERALEVLRDDCLDEFDSIGADIIYALPGQTVSTLDETLSSILSIPSIKHISAYELTIAENTPFGRHKKLLPQQSQDLSAEMYGLINKRCTERGMVQYEVSNYALPGHESIHNKAYWSHKPYIGLGAAAHSYIHPKRWSNVPNINEYVSSISSNNRAVDFEETLGADELSEEIIFLGLRNAEGIDEDDFLTKTGTPFCTGSRKKLLQRYADSGFIKKSGSRWIPSSKGMLFADMMAREL